MSSVTLIEANTLRQLTSELASHLLTASGADPFSISSLVFPNQQMKYAITWEVLSRHTSADQADERCLSGIRKLFPSELISTLSDLLDVPQLPRSEELAWGLLARKELGGEPIKESQYSDAFQVSEAIFRLPTRATSALTDHELMIALPRSLTTENEHDELSLKELWRVLIEQRSSVRRQPKLLESLAPHQGVALEIPDQSKVSASKVKQIKRIVGDIHLVVPKALSIFLLKLLKAASYHVSVYLYVLSDESQESGDATRESFAKRGAFHLNRDAIHRYCEPTQSEPLTHQLEQPAPPRVSLYRCTHDARQVEALHEQLSFLLREDSTITQREVYVLVSDMKRFLPHIEQRFHIGHGTPKNRLCGVIIDRGLEEENPYEQLLFKLCASITRRLSLSMVFDLFNLTPIRERFSMSDQRFEKLRSILEKVKLKWGLDLQDRVQLSGVSSPLGTWRNAIERLMLSELMDPVYTPETPYLQITLPAEALGGEDYEALSVFLEFFSALELVMSSHPGDLQGAGGAPFTVWQSWLLDAMASLTPRIQTDEGARLQKYVVKEAISQVERDLSESHPDALHQLTLSTGAVMSAISAALKSYRSTRGKIGAGITFAPISVAAGATSRVVAFLGMEEGAFPKRMQLSLADPLNPRNAQRLAMSQSETKPAWIEESEFSPSRLESDWASFLSACTNSQEHILAFWSGRPRFDHEEGAEPCGPVRYLIERYLKPRGSEPYWQEVPVSGYSTELFRKPDNIPPALAQSVALTSTSKIAFESASILRDPSQRINSAVLGAYQRGRMRGSSAPERITLNQLSRSISNPKSVFLQSVGIQLTKAKTETDHNIALGLDNLQQWQVKTELVGALDSLSHKLLRQGMSNEEKLNVLSAAWPKVYEDRYTKLRAEGALPPGAIGRSIFDEIWGFSTHYSWELHQLMSDYQPKPIQTTVELDCSASHNLQVSMPITIYQPYDPNAPVCIFDYTVSKDAHGKPEKLLKTWIKALALQDDRATLNINAEDSSIFNHGVVTRFGSVTASKVNLQDCLSLSHSKQTSHIVSTVDCNFEGLEPSVYSSFSDLLDHYHSVQDGDPQLLSWSFDAYGSKSLTSCEPKAIFNYLQNKRSSSGSNAYEPNNQDYEDHVDRLLFGSEHHLIEEGSQTLPGFQRGFQLAEEIKSCFSSDNGE